VRFQHRLPFMTQFGGGSLQTPQEVTESLILNTKQQPQQK